MPTGRPRGFAGARRGIQVDASAAAANWPDCMRNRLRDVVIVKWSFGLAREISTNRQADCGAFAPPASTADRSLSENASTNSTSTTAAQIPANNQIDCQSCV